MSGGRTFQKIVRMTTEKLRMPATWTNGERSCFGELGLRSEG